RFGGIKGKNPGVEVAHVVDDRQLEVQTRTGFDVDDLAEAEDDGVLALIDHEQRQAGEHRQGDQDDQGGAQLGSHHRDSLSRERSASRERWICAGVASALSWRDGGSCEPAPAVDWRILSRGRYNRLPPPARWSMTILLVDSSTCCTVSRYNRS